MRKRILIAAAAAAGTMLLAAPALPAFADGAPLLFVGSTTGPAVKDGDVLTAGLASGSTAKIVTTSGGSTGVTCTTASISAKVTANSDASTGNADESVTALTTTNCTSNIAGVTKVNSVVLNNLPYTATVSPGFVVSVTGTIQSTVSLQTVLGAVTCVYTIPSLAGTASNTGNTLAFSNQDFTLKSGPAVCPKNGFLTTTLGPVIDTSQGNGDVFVG
jgi:hypothetical protein